MNTSNTNAELHRLVTEEEGFEEDILQVALGIRAVIRRSFPNKTEIAKPVPLAVIQRDLMEIITLMRLKGTYTIFCQRQTHSPGWEAPDERLLRDWIQHAVSEEIWTHEVMLAAFGSYTVRLWEIPIEGWRSALRIYLDQWVIRTPELLEEIQPFIEEEVEESEEYNASTFSGKSKNYN